MTGKPLPTNLKLMRGNPGKRKLNAREPMPRVGRPKPLECLSAAGREHFARLMDELTAVRVLTVADGPALSGLAEALASYEEAVRALETGGKVVKQERGVTRSPWLMIQKQAWEQMQRGFSDFGLTPSSRSKIQTLPAGSDDEEERFFGS